MDRRGFMQLAGFTGLSLFLPSLLGREAEAAPVTYGGPYFLHMHAAGGWDPTLLCDAKLTFGDVTPLYENRLVSEVNDLKNGIVVPAQTAAGKFLLRNNNNPVEDPADFFTTVGKDVLVLNGIDTQTNNHDTGVQGLACGHNDIELPALAALFAGKVAKEMNIPMAFLAGGQYNRTGDVVGVSRFPGDKVSLLANPFQSQGGEDPKTFIPKSAVDRITLLRNQRLDRIQAQATLPRTKRTVAAYRDAVLGGASVSLLQSIGGAAAPPISAFADQLAPDTRDYLTGLNNNVPRFVEIGRPLETILRCFEEGVSASATFAQGGFDTHADHDVAQANAMSTFIARLRYALIRINQSKLKDKVVVMVTSDFGRTPRYNTGRGKDHWNVTSALLYGRGIRGGRAIGGSDEGFKAKRVGKGDVSLLLPDRDANGLRIHPAHMHQELRRVLDLNQAPFISQFPLPAGTEAIPLLA